jgi:hypothetical protein
MSLEYLEAITNSTDLKNLYDVMTNVLRVSPGPDDVFLKRMKDWIVVPCESNDHFSDDECQRIAQAALNSGTFQSIGLALETMVEGEDSHQAVALTVSSDAIEEFDNLYSFYWCVLFDREMNWLICCTKLDYFLVAGKKEFVEDALGRNSDESFDDFQQYLMLESYQPLKEHLESVYHQCRYQYQIAESGTFVDIRKH